MYIALNEVYFGKTKNLLECEKLIASLKKEYDGKYFECIKVLDDRRFERFQELFANEFGLKKFILSIELVTIENAMTPPISWGIDVMPTCRTRANLICDNKGFKFRPEAGYIISTIIYSGLLFNPEVTAGEIIGILIHEIGHNFQSVIDETSFMLTDAVHITTIIVAAADALIKGYPEVAVQAGLLPFIYSNFVKDVMDELQKKIA